MSAGRLRFWLRWSGRDLRRRWLVVLAIAMTIAIGTGAYAGLSSLSHWRRASNDASYARLAFHDCGSPSAPAARCRRAPSGRRSPRSRPRTA